MKINFWPDNQVCVSCNNSVLINDDKFPIHTYGCLLNFEVYSKFEHYVEMEEFKCIDNWEKQKEWKGK